MRIDKNAIVYFVNEEYGVVIRVNGATNEVAMWERKTSGFTRRLGRETAGFLALHDRYERQWCPAHATKSLATAEKAARLLLPCLPGVDGMAIAREAKLRALRPEIRTTSADALIKKINARWREREAKYAAL